jgi:kinesin family protein 3/17
MVSRAVKDIFQYIQKNETENSKYVVKVSYLQIYTEIISDLLKPERRHLTIREDKEKGVFVENLSEWVVEKPSEIFELLKKGMALRTTAPTKINDLSSRSHAVFIIYLENVVSMNIEGKQVSTVRRAKLNLIGKDWDFFFIYIGCYFAFFWFLL